MPPLRAGHSEKDPRDRVSGGSHPDATMVRSLGLYEPSQEQQNREFYNKFNTCSTL